MDNKKYFIIEKEIFLGTPKYSIHKGKMYQLETAMKIMLALDTLNEDRERYSHYLQEVDKGMLPLVLTNEVVEEQSELPFWFISLGFGGDTSAIPKSFKIP